MNEGRKNLLKGSQAEAFAVNKLIQMGLSVSMPVFKQCKYDCIVDDGNKLYKTQIKKITSPPDRPNIVKTRLSSGHYDSSGQMQNKKYNKNDIDSFLFVDLDKNNCFWMFFDETPDSSITISYKRSKYANKINYYKDFLIENVFDSEDRYKNTDENEGSIFDF